MEGNMQPATSANIIGPDINEYRGDVNYQLLATKTPYCYLRSSSSGTGTFRVDKKFFEYVKGLKSVGILSGAYHYSKPSADFTTADSQCDDFIRVLQEAYGQGNYGDLFPVIDVEAPVDKSISTDTLLDWVDRFRKRFERKTRRILMIYTGSFFVDLYNNFYHSQKGFILANMPLWIAMYKEIPGNPPYPKDQGGWTRWRMWQYTEQGTIAGVNPPVDLNYGPTNLDFLKPPRVVRNFKATPVGKKIHLTWSGNTDLDLNGYNIFINGNYVTTLSKNATSYTIDLGPGARPHERYELTIEAFDIDGDFSPTRAKAQVTLRGDYESLNNEENEMNSKEVRNNYIDPVDILEDKFIKRSKYEQFYGREEDFEFKNLNLEHMGKDYNYQYDHESDNITHDNFSDKFHGENYEYSSDYRETDYNDDMDNYTVKPVFKYYLDDEDEEFDDVDDLEENNGYAPVYNEYSYGYDETDFNYEDNYFDLEEEYGEDNYGRYDLEDNFKDYKYNYLTYNDGLSYFREDEEYSSEDKDYTLGNKGHILEDEDYTVEDRDDILEEKDYTFEDRGYILEDEDYTLEDRDNILEDKDYTFEDRDYILEDKNYTLEDKDHILEDEDYTLEDDDSYLRYNEEDKGISFGNSELAKHGLQYKGRKSSTNNKDLKERYLSTYLNELDNNMEYDGIFENTDEYRHKKCKKCKKCKNNKKNEKYCFGCKYYGYESKKDDYYNHDHYDYLKHPHYDFKFEECDHKNKKKKKHHKHHR
jgi:GH25 family lysozyme M1 (1,4-beta-N-acetylmuramidase)